MKNALMAADYVIIPVSAEAFHANGLTMMAETIEEVKKANTGLFVLGVLITRYDGRALIRRKMAEVIETAATGMNAVVFSTRIRDGVAVQEAQAYAVDLADYAPKSNPCKDYAALADEVLERIGRIGRINDV